MARRKEAHGGGHGWFVTFADLMGLLVSFFVMLVAFSNQDSKKLQIVAGSMRDAFGVQTNVRYSGVVEVDGLPTRPKLKNAAHIDPEDASATPTTDEQDHKREHGAQRKNDQAFALAAASLRQALQDMPELTEASKHIMVEETKEGLNIDLVDQEGRSMFPEGSKEPYERTRHIIEKLAGPIKATPYRVSITGHTSASKTPTRSVELVGGPRQCRAPDPRRGGPAYREHLRGSRQGGYRPAVSRRPLYRRQPPGHHYIDARSASGSAGFTPLSALIVGTTAGPTHPFCIVL
jgi:chemotaxis protein MotB